MGIYGQDWSSYQGTNPDTTGLSFVFTKITEGLGYVNPRWKAQMDWARSKGLVVGGYHYPHMHNNAVSEVQYMLSQWTPEIGDIVVLDWEGYDASNAGIGVAESISYKNAFLAQLKAKLPDNPVGTYCNTDYLARDHNMGDFLWIATANRAAGDPGINLPWVFHQYSANSVDKDYANFNSLADLKNWALSFNQGDIVTPADIAAIAAAVWNHTELDATTGQPVRVGAVQRYIDTLRTAQTKALTDQITALTASVTALTKAVGGTLTNAQITSVIQEAIKNTAITATINVNGTVK